jgi:predicted transcriptional regulator of viral defense system
MQMAYRPTKTAFRRLTALARGQGGYFTAKQAAEVGYSYPHLVYHASAGNFEHVGHGIYRLPEIPPTENDDLVRLSFWSRDRKDLSQAVASHQTALLLHGLSDILPSKTHLTVPLTFRKAPTKGVVIHRASLDSQEIDQREGFSVTTPLRTLIDVAADDTVSDEHLQRAVAESLERGLVRRSKLDSAIRKNPQATRLSKSLEAAS